MLLQCIAGELGDTGDSGPFASGDSSNSPHKSARSSSAYLSILCRTLYHMQMQWSQYLVVTVGIGITGSNFGPLDEAVARARIVNLCLCLFVALRPHFLLLLDDVCNLDVQSWNVLVEFVTLVGAHRFNVLTVATSRPFGEVNDPYLEQIAYVPNLKIISKMDHVSIHTLPDFEPEHMRELIRHNLYIPASALPTSVFNFLVNTCVASSVLCH